MISVPTLAHVVAARNVRRLLACGCVVVMAVIALPVLVLLSVMNNLLPDVGGASVNQVDPANGVGIGTAQPLTPGRFRVSQGFGCTAVAVEPSPAPGYTCPPDPAHSGYRRFHTGIDLAAPSGLTVFAVVDGTVRVIESAVGFGVHITLTSSAQQRPSVVYLYGHLSEVAVPDGDVVRAGDPIGYVGSTGNSSGPHLHFEVDVAGLPVNPCSTFPRGYLVPAGVAAAGCLAWTT
ncbi:MAG: M23 family metallopeptidase [Candidatus Dormibacteraeota bacterium]|nr:M23 family metallopeptidase [Candidatus Dormibacteraeota bacterium]